MRVVQRLRQSCCPARTRLAHRRPGSSAGAPAARADTSSGAGGVNHRRWGVVRENAAFLCRLSRVNACESWVQRHPSTFAFCVL